MFKEEDEVKSGKEEEENSTIAPIMRKAQGRLQILIIYFTLRLPTKNGLMADEIVDDQIVHLMMYYTLYGDLSRDEITCTTWEPLKNALT